MITFKANKRRELAARRAMPLLGAAMMLLGGARGAWAHQDPSTCNHPGVAIEMLLFRADQVTLISGTDKVSPCETIFYQVRLSKPGDVTVCAFEGGKLFIDLPDGTHNDVTPSSGIPCIGGTSITPNCTATEVFSNKIQFTVVEPTPQTDGVLNASASYGQPPCGGPTGNPATACGLEHNSPGDLANVVSGSLANIVEIFPCPPNTPCLTSICDPNLAGPAACTTTPVTCGPSQGLPCTQVGPGTCVNNSCEVAGCDDTGRGCFDDKTTCPCPDGSQHQGTGACASNNACVAGGCDPTSGCFNTPTSCPCPDGSQHQGPGDCASNNACVAEGCNPTTGCFNTPTACPCPDGSQHQGPGNCASNDGCTQEGCNPTSGCFDNTATCNDVCAPCDPTQPFPGCTKLACDAAGTPPQCCPKLACRVTGGGRVDACGPDHSFCDPSTPNSCAPDTCTSPAIDATHGGQVGAPIGVATPFTPDSACIAGEWSHVRHVKKGLDGNFHARSFDSLECACLPCPENPDAPGVVGVLCNPDDRICGPEPRRAPANKICFSGPGDYAMTNGKRDKRSVVFRVDVEDRSEPGGANGPPPPDRYRMRIWFVDPDSTDGLTLRSEVACADPTTESITAPTPDIDDGGDLFRGNQQIHPSLKKTCP